jgi:hypothetical protein
MFIVSFVDDRPFMFLLKIRRCLSLSQMLKKRGGGVMKASTRRYQLDPQHHFVAFRTFFIFIYFFIFLFFYGHKSFGAEDNI